MKAVSLLNGLYRVVLATWAYGAGGMRGLKQSSPL